MIFKHHSLSPGSFSVEAEPTLFVFFVACRFNKFAAAGAISSASNLASNSRPPSFQTARKLHEIWGYFGDGDEDIQPACLVFQNSHRVMDRSDGQFNASFETGKDRTGSGELVSGRNWEKTMFEM